MLSSISLSYPNPKRDKFLSRGTDRSVQLCMSGFRVGCILILTVINKIFRDTKELEKQQGAIFFIV